MLEQDSGNRTKYSKQPSNTIGQMEETKLTELSDEELLQKQKKMKSGYLFSTVLIGFLIGVAVYSLIKNGIDFFTFFPLFFIFLCYPTGKKKKH